MNFSKFYNSLDEKQRKYFDRYREAQMAEKKLNETVARGVCVTFVFLCMLSMFGPGLIALNNSLKK